MKKQFKFAMIFQNIGMIDALQCCDFVFDVTRSGWIFDGHGSFFSLHLSCFEHFSVRSLTKKTAAFIAPSDSETSIVNLLIFTPTTRSARYG